MKTKLYNNTISFPSYEHFASGIILATFSSLIFVAACALLLLYYWKRIGRAMVETRIGVVLLFLGALLTTLLSLGFYVHLKVYGIYRLLLVIFVGVVFLWAGTMVLFNIPGNAASGDDDRRPLIPVGHTNGSMGIVMWVIALPLCALEMLFSIGGFKSKAPIYASVKFVCLVQKLVQASIYHFSLRHKIPRYSMRMGCSWFLKTISLFNFAMWIDSIVTTHTDNAFVMELFGDGFSIVKTVYNTLIIDYRLLCSILFLEHALEIEGNEAHDGHNMNHHQQIEDSIHNDNAVQTQQAGMIEDVQTRHYSGYGHVIGLVCICVQLVNGLQYMDLVGTWTSIFPILCNIVVIVTELILVNGETLSLSEDDNLIRWRETESKAIDVMIGFMGAIGFVYRIMKTSFCLIWSSQARGELQTYLIWNSSKEAARAISVVFQLYVFVKVGPHFCQEARNQRRSICHLLVPAVMLGLLSTFISCTIDQYHGQIEYLINHSQLDPSMTSFFNAAAPIHLGFSLHMFLHFYIIKRKMRRTTAIVRPTRRVQVVERKSINSDLGEREPLLSMIEDR
ncbi:uncharacterized protein LOC116305891 [Actinia tenebrosa]|uniref:Uncharacterized protein LOC116305891 n=1 Tax=Actinia tenebrosa TaxID=6105 RepID=A0A6P8IXD6_ACTTE|nr:uncharacterized protein LOC116305891 [Actinia tenebrosa]